MPTQKTTFIFIHGMSGARGDHWYPWLADKLRALGHNVVLETFPGNLKAESAITIKFTEEIIKNVSTPDFNVITHSSGCALGLRIAERYKLNGLYIVGGLFEDLGYAEEIKSGLFKGGFDFEKVRANSKRIVQIDSDKDPFISTEHFAELASRLGAEHIVLPGRGHFGHPGDSPKEFPELLEIIKRTI